MSSSSIVRRAAPMIVYLLALACRQAGAEFTAAPATTPAAGEKAMKSTDEPFDSGKREEAILAGGCFWGVEELIRQQPGVVDIEVGYTGGTTRHPDYEQVHAGVGGHAEAVKIVFDPERTTYENLLLFFFKMHDPTTKNRQGNDIGASYRSAIFYTSAGSPRRSGSASTPPVPGNGRW